MFPFPDIPVLPPGALEGAHVLIFIALTLRIVSRRLNPGAALAWLLLIGFLPFAGALVYMLIGERSLGRIRRRRLARIRAGSPPPPPHEERVAAQDRPLALLAARAARASVLPAGPIELVDGAPAIIAAMLEDVKNARETCDMAFYIWSAGGLADEMAAALEAAALRGVSCRLLLDGVGSAHFLASESARRLARAGVKLKTALATGLFRALFVRVDLRLHRKIVAIDGVIAWSGSMNLVDPRFFKQGAGVGEWIDAMLRFSGPPARELARVFDNSWRMETGDVSRPPSSVAPVAADDGRTCLIAPSGPDRGLDDMRMILLALVYRAREELVLTTPYFAPDEPLFMALKGAAQRGVAVTLIVPARVDSVLTRYASRAFFGDLMRAGARILQFGDGLLHTKSLTLDGRVALFGTVNLDMRSLSLNFEVAALLFDEATVGAIRALQASYEARCVAIDPQLWAARPARERLLENVCRLASPLL